MPGPKFQSRTLPRASHHLHQLAFFPQFILVLSLPSGNDLHTLSHPCDVTPLGFIRQGHFHPFISWSSSDAQIKDPVSRRQESAWAELSGLQLHRNMHSKLSCSVCSGTLTAICTIVELMWGRLTIYTHIHT